MDAYISSTLIFPYLWVVNFPLEELLYYKLRQRMNEKKFPQDIQCIVEPVNGIGGIYISNIEAAENPNTLKRLSIEAVMTAIKGKNLDQVIPKHIQYMYIPAVDHESFDISYYFQQSNNFIDQERKRTNVLVHCMAGISRSVTLVIAYLMKYNQKSFNQAFNILKSRRRIVHPNQSFIKQLRNYQNQLKTKNDKDLAPTYTANSKQNMKQRFMKQISNEKAALQQKLQNKIGKMRYTYNSKMCAQKQNNVKTYDQVLKSSIKLIFKNERKNQCTRIL